MDNARAFKKLELLFFPLSCTGEDYSKCIAGDSERLAGFFPMLHTIPCLQCVCFKEDGSEQCRVRRKTCPPLNCTVSKDSGCCKVCKGCFFNGVQYKHGDRWSDSLNSCRRYICKEGIVTNYLESCHVNKAHKTLGTGNSTSCCTLHSDITKVLQPDTGTNDSTAIQSSTWRPLNGDPCTLCRNENGKSTCRAVTCPALPCATLKRRDPSKCCRECRDSTYVPSYMPEKWCLVNGRQVEDGQWHRISSCHFCQCLNGTAICKITACPWLDCKPENQIYSGSGCCPKCQDMSICLFMGETHANGDTWYLKGCVECTCRNGKNYCKRERCLNAPTHCPRGQTLGYKVGSCCKKCVEKQHHCITYGDPHYQTFDGKFYSFQGTCKYYFAKDSNNTFTIQVRNSARYTGRFSWTKSVFLKFEKYTISLQQKLKVRVNGKKIRAPYLDYPVLDIRQDRRYINLYTNIGVSITWDGDSYLSVTVPDRYKNRLSGLCGNFNGNSKDDLNLSNGVPGHPKTFAAQWLVGKDSSCHHMYKAAFLPRNRCWGFKLIHAHKVCRVFRDRKLRKCHIKVNPAVYHRSCVFDVCECPFNARCECGAVKAYMAECKRRVSWKFKWRSEEVCKAVVSSSRWRFNQNDAGNDVSFTSMNKKIVLHPSSYQDAGTTILVRYARCTGGSRFSSCGPACKPTCNSHHRGQTCNKPCVQGCHCNAGFVWHENRCILQRRCPNQ